MVDTKVIRLEAHQIDEAGELIAKAFEFDPLFTYVIPVDDDNRLSKLKSIGTFSIRYSSSTGYVYTTAEQMKGVAVWYPPGCNSFNIIGLLQPDFLAIPFQLGLWTLWRLVEFSGEVWAYYERERSLAHWYLSILAVAPYHQRQGVGSSLLQPVLKEADTSGLPCYLETEVEKNLHFYRQHGFEVVKTIDLPRSRLRLWSMKREPKRIDRLSKHLKNGKS